MLRLVPGSLDVIVSYRVLPYHENGKALRYTTASKSVEPHDFSRNHTADGLPVRPSRSSADKEGRQALDTQ